MPISPKRQPETAPLSHPAHADPSTWAIIHEFASSDHDATLPQVHASLEQHFGTYYIASDWNPALDAIMAAEGNVVQATEAIDKLSAATCTQTGLVIKFSARMKPPQLKSLEQDLSKSVANLKGQNRIFGDLLTLYELLDPIEEKENFDMDTLVFKDDVAIIAEVHYWEALRNRDVIEVDSDDDDDGDNVENPGISYSDILILIPDSRAVYDLIFTLFILLTLSR